MTKKMSSIDALNTTSQNNTIAELNVDQTSNKKPEKGKKKGVEDNVNEAGLGTVDDDDFPVTKKRRRGKGKEKNGHDVDPLAEGIFPVSGPCKSKKQDTDQVVTTQQQTDFGPSERAMTQTDLL